MYGVGGDFAVNLIKAFENHFDLLPSSNEIHAEFTSYGGEAKICSTLKDFTTYFIHCVSENKDIKLIEVPITPKAQYQCNKIKLLNTYISSKNGIPEAVEKWNNIINGK